MILVVFALPLLAAAAPRQQTAVRDSTRVDTTRLHGFRRPVTAELRASAFHDELARDLFTRARAARVRQDSSLVSYDAKVVQRLTVKAAFGRVPLEKLVYRQENAARVRWDRGGGAHVDITGARVAIPPIGMPEAERDAVKDQLTDTSLIPLPYFPGYEPLWPGEQLASPQVNEHDIVNPLADGAEAYYTYRSRDSISLHLQGGRTITVQQIDVRPRFLAFNGVVGSLWIDEASGQIVRAAYRLALPAQAAFTVTDSSGKPNRIARVIIGALTPKISASLTSVVVEYELFEGYWLPRLQTAEGFGTVSFARVPISFTNVFTYTSVNHPSGLAPIPMDSTHVPDDTVKARVKTQCDSGNTRVIVHYNQALKVPVEMRSPCKIDELARSPDLPTSIYDPGEQIFDLGDAHQLIGEALSMTDQPPLTLTALPAPSWRYGLSMTRYNRIEGWSTGLAVDQVLGAGLDLNAAIRDATADHTPRWEASLGRSNGAQTVRLGGYDRLSSVSERDGSLSFGSAISGFVFGRDDALYYRASGGELTWRSNLAPHVEIRLFADRRVSAMHRVSAPLTGSFPPDLLAERGTYRGGSIDWTGSRGIDPSGLRLASDLRVEAAKGDSLYGRASLDLMATRPLLAGLDGSISGAVGSSIGFLPSQRQWYLGGTGTVRGERPDPAAGGNAFWLARAELGPKAYAVKPSLFADFGWAGDRNHFDEVGRPVSAVGLGFSFLDGAIRLDLARGLWPEKRTQLSFYLGSIF